MVGFVSTLDFVDSVSLVLASLSYGRRKSSFSGFLSSFSVFVIVSVH